MKNLIVFRSAKHPVVEECIRKISQKYIDCNIWLCIQKECLDVYSGYDNVQFIVFPNGMFNYEKTNIDKGICDSLKKIKIDDVYIPHSTIIPKCEEIEKIVFKILKKKKAIYYGPEGNMNEKKININCINPKKVFERIYSSVDYHLMKIIYIFFARKG